MSTVTPGTSRAEPAPDVTLLPRTRLHEVLLGDPRPVTLISAPAGSGKSSLLAALLTGTDGGEPSVTALVELDAPVHTPGMLWDLLLTTVQHAVSGTMPAGILDLAAPPDAVGTGFLDRFVAAVEELPTGLRLLIDDLHMLADPAVFASLDALLLRPPANLEVVLSSRTEPPLSLARLRVAGRLREITERDLAFAPDESASLAREAGLDLSPAQLGELHRRTEGWAVGVRVALLALQEADDIDAALARFGGDDHAMAAYLRDEVLSPLDPQLREVLIRTSVCTPVPVELARELTGRPDAGALFEQLVHRRLLTAREGRERSQYRVHAVLRSYLTAELEHRDPHLLADLHRRAGRWYLEVGASLRGLQQLAASGDLPALAAGLRQVGVGLLLDGEDRGLAALLPSDRRITDPVVQLFATITCLLHQGPDASNETLSSSQLAAMAGHEDPWLATLAASTWVRRDLLAGQSLSRSRSRAQLAAQVDAPTDDPDLDLWARFHLAYGALQAADLHAAQRLNAEVIPAAERGGRDALSVDANAALSIALLMADELVEARAHAEAALATAERRGWSREARAMPAQLTLAWVGYLQAQPAVAQRHVEIASTSLGPSADRRLRMSLETCGELVRIDAGDDVLAALRAHHRRLRSLPESLMSPVFHAHVAPPLVVAALRAGERGWAVDLVAAHSHPGLSRGDKALLEALLLLAQGQPREAHRVLAAALGDDDEQTLVTSVRARLLRAHLDLQRGATVHAETAIATAIALAAPAELRRPFHDATPDVRDLAITMVDRLGRYRGFASSLAATLTSADRPAPQVLLTPTEAVILAELPSLLSVREIADARGVSVNTVKTHLTSLYRKLAATSRREAVEQARRRGLL